MAEPKEIICEVCREKPATHHICFAETGKAKDLCVECYEKSAPPEYFAIGNDISHLIQNGTCTYCGQPSKGGGGWTSGPGIPGLSGLGLQMQELWCEECSRDLKDFYDLPEQREAMNAEFDVADEEALERAAQQLEKREAAKFEFMRSRISKRRNSG